MTLLVQEKTTIYQFHGPDAPQTTPQRVGALWAEVLQNRSLEASKPLLGRLGIAETDLSAQNAMLALMEQASLHDVEIVSDKYNSGVYFLSRNKVRFAVFKVGSKRADVELQVRKIAHKVGLEKHALPGVFCTIANPRFAKGEPIQEELWNGLVKVYTSGANYEEAVYMDSLGVKEPPTLTGILEPYLENKEALSVLEMAKMTLLAILLGLRDAKPDGIAGATFFDVEDCMPSRFLLKAGESPNSSVAALHLPYLQHPTAKEALSLKDLEILIEFVDEKKLEVTQFLADLKREKISFFDSVSEQLQDKETAWDHGGCPIEIEKPAKIMESDSIIEVETAKSMFLDEQLMACGDRIVRLRKVLDTYRKMGIGPNTLEIVSNVDPMYGAHLNALQRQGSRGAPEEVVGRFTPKASQVKLFPEDISLIDSLISETSLINKRAVSAPAGLLDEAKEQLSPF
jgi:hypothetical protein